jgi:hypothetical protein
MSVGWRMFGWRTFEWIARLGLGAMFIYAGYAKLQHPTAISCSRRGL